MHEIPVRDQEQGKQRKKPALDMKTPESYVRKDTLPKAVKAKSTVAGIGIGVKQFSSDENQKYLGPTGGDGNKSQRGNKNYDKPWLVNAASTDMIDKQEKVPSNENKSPRDAVQPLKTPSSSKKSNPWLGGGKAGPRP